MGSNVHVFSLNTVFKGPIPSDLVFLFTMLIKCQCPVELILIVKPQGLHVLLAEIRQCI